MRCLLLSVACLFTSSCAVIETTGATLDCVDPWRFGNCIVFDLAEESPDKKAHSNIRDIYVADYKPPKLTKPQKTWKE